MRLVGHAFGSVSGLAPAGDSVAGRYFALTTLKKTSSYEQAAFVEKGGWATMPGRKAVDIGVPQACAAILSNLK